MEGQAMDVLSSGMNILLIVLGFGLLIFVHELGHFLAAKWAGIRTEAFAIGMGPVIVSWRKGVGLVLGSTHRKVVARAGKGAHELTNEELEKFCVGETEYSLRWIPIGGFVKMLGQEDANPSAVSEDPRSYTQRPIGKRMIVVSAGVIMNLLLAAVLFVVAFMVGVPFPAPVVGDVRSDLPAATTMADNAEALGLSEAGLQPGDRVLRIDDQPARTFADLQIASAMSRPGVPVRLTVERSGIDDPIRFAIVPRKDEASGLLSIGVAPASSTTLYEDDKTGTLQAALERSGLDTAGVLPGMRMVEAEGNDITTHEQLQRLVDASEGRPLQTTWSAVDRHGERTGSAIRAPLPVQPLYQVQIYAGAQPEGLPNFAQGLLGLVPLVRIESISGSFNEGRLKDGDVILRAGHVDGPRRTDLMAELRLHAGSTIDMLVLRDGEETEVTARVTRKGKLSVFIAEAWDVPILAQPMTSVRPSMAVADRGRSVPTSVSSLELLGRSRLLAVDDTPVADWPELRRALREHTQDAATFGRATSVELTVEAPTPGRETERLTVPLDAYQVQALHELGWTSPLPSAYFQPIYTERNAGGNPLTAISMGLQETHKLILMTYLTIDRLFRGSVGVEQLRGPLGIVHMGSQIIDGGFTYVIFFLAMISVNLAVINFLPIPIVDGGLFLFLIYEKIKGRPPSIAFQNAATLVGIFLIGTVLLVVTWHDVMRLIT
ncbi:MAG: M50 family metallopeptidase [Planctomycetota bacterium]|jgi:regulator of sigma E protease